MMKFKSNKLQQREMLRYDEVNMHRESNKNVPME